MTNIVNNSRWDLERYKVLGYSELERILYLLRRKFLNIVYGKRRYILYDEYRNENENGYNSKGIYSFISKEATSLLKDGTWFLNTGASGKEEVYKTKQDKPEEITFYEERLIFEKISVEQLEALIKGMKEVSKRHTKAKVVKIKF